MKYISFTEANSSVGNASGQREVRPHDLHALPKQQTIVHQYIQKSVAT